MLTTARSTWSLLRKATGRDLTFVLVAQAVAARSLAAQLLLGKALLDRLVGPHRAQGLGELLPLLILLGVVTVIATATMISERRTPLVESWMTGTVADRVVSVVAGVRSNASTAPSSTATCNGPPEPLPTSPGRS